MAAEPPVLYRGMRYFKCDLQMQTHTDRGGWRGPRYGASLEDMRRAAHDYISRCYEVDLEVIAITDHNFASKDFIPLLRDAVDELAPEFGYRITIFPGFEITADVGKGMHALALFDPRMDLTEIDHLLTNCGVPPQRFKPGGAAARSTERLPKILNVVQKRDPQGRLQGVVICPHAQAEAGIFDNEAIAEWLQQAEFLNPELLCIEVPKPPTQMSPNWQRLLRAGPDCMPDWRRRRPIACVMSSDAKALRPEDGAENYIGFRYSWIKMSEPSIEALRQAFLDPESRIRLRDGPPDDDLTHPRILSIGVRNAAFLADQVVGFSPQLNTIIGGRGTGKSTVVEYLRIALQQENTVGGSEASRNLQKLRKSLRNESIVTVAIEKEGATFSLQSIGGLPPAVTSGEELTDIPRFFPCRVFSQREIFEIADSLNARRQLVEDIVRMRLDELSRREEDLIREIRQLNQQIEELPALERRVRELQTEVKDLTLRIARLDAVMEPLAAGQRFAEERTLFDDLRASAPRIAVAIEELTQDLTLRSTAVSPELLKGPYGGLIERIWADADAALHRLTTSISDALAKFTEDIDAGFQISQFTEWDTDFRNEQGKFDSIKRELETQGTNPAEYLEYQQERRRREKELSDAQKSIAAKKLLRVQRDGSIVQVEDGQKSLFDQLLDIWHEQTAIRQQAAKRLMDALPRTLTGQPFLKIEVHPFGDEEAFLGKMRTHLKDRRRIGEEDWDILMKAVFFRAAQQEASPMDILIAELRAARAKDLGAKIDLIWGSNRYIGVLLDWLRPNLFSELQLWRTPDRVSVELFRQDGSRVGELDGPELSIGQRCTAVLAMLLARDDVPVIIDQPEEDLDNEFIYRELVPLIRRVKEQRQIIFVSHNANIPVNADAELIASLEVRDGRGVQRTLNDELAVGGLDRSAVRNAVEEIMEGSEEAFRKRYEKYGF